ncbi:MAG: FAD-binding oxidoreductase [Candidatus Brocadiia bacterium]
MYDKLRKIISAERISRLPEDRLAASYDASKLQHLPDIVVKPLNAAEISDVLKIASEHATPVYPRGAASSVTGSAVPVKGGIVIDLSLMNRIIEINPVNFTAVVEPGVVCADFQKAVSRHGLFYPPDPASADFCTLGGNVACGAGGLRCIKYGTTRDYVLGLEAVLPSGQIIHTGRKTLKRSTGYDLARLFIGSEGTLGIITQIILRLVPKPQSEATFFIFYDNEPAAVKLGLDTLAKRILPRAIEFMDASSLKAVTAYLKDIDFGKSEIRNPKSEIGSGILIELDGDPNDLAGQAKALEELISQSRPGKMLRANGPEEAKSLWAIRKAVSPALYSITAQKASEDICVPRDQITHILAVIKSIESKYGIPIATFGHLGDGNLHVNFLISNEAHKTSLEKALDELFTETVKCGGTLSGEHGIGLTKSRFLALELSAAEIELMKQLKTLFDPKGIMNSGKIFPAETTNAH